jgi:hypothetical protein
VIDFAAVGMMISNLCDCRRYNGSTDVHTYDTPANC